MKNVRHLLTVGLIMAGSMTSFADESPRPIRQVNTLKTVMLEKISELSLQRYGINEVELQVSYTINADGHVTVTSVTGASCFVNEYVRMIIEKDEVPVESSLIDQEVTMNIKYARV